jgi:Uri superfamily endonuclease
LKGSYALLLKLDRDRRIPVGALGVKDFPRGHYVYIGSAMNGIESRVRRHLSKEKKIHWHIDHFLKEARVIGVRKMESNKKQECDVASGFSERFDIVSDFGSSDCSCSGHLFYGGKTRLQNYIREIGFEVLSL